MNRIDELFWQKKNNILSVFYTAGYPDLNDTIAIARHLQAAGVDMIELGIPFSDPIADGPVIQHSNVRAISNGMNVKTLLDQVRAIRQEVAIPVVLMGYLNPVLQYGLEKFFFDTAAAGADGVILPDLPVHEYADKYKGLAQQAGLRVIFLVAPTTSDERIREIDETSTGFLYAVSLSGVTGARKQFSEEQEKFLDRLSRLKLKNPVLAGFGISNAESYQRVCRYVNGAIVGSAFIELLGKGGFDGEIKRFIEMLKEDQACVQ
ncbi:MAG: tryptophan synthase subunit alpha [Cyclobacteriaceae bacterium]|nr:tryptophan synthase subunit alpha [Cyclobacteriaceae bacterium]